MVLLSTPINNNGYELGWLVRIPIVAWYPYMVMNLDGACRYLPGLRCESQDHLLGHLRGRDLRVGKWTSLLPEGAPGRAEDGAKLAVLTKHSRVVFMMLIDAY